MYDSNFKGCDLLLLKLLALRYVPHNAVQHCLCRQIRTVFSAVQAFLQVVDQSYNLTTKQCLSLGTGRKAVARNTM